ncbi:hypothetical protein P170DRAFT_285073 [Aspergillus steynii IBT 23096]|uniref:Uncharacterized protein n=1 Tax=Aspergillus steynii IBT 23096 TaxID=1392250 RepID=A0A2I2FUP7_9EURO|nr:uncharacterized protein P170DRAFT_285073 [Aspergillus steynii IBT 23096]PLB44369.1 hypothetical protein P170DRAFT_285073 [Aspergillus steynii IBT 23096]
METLDKAWHTAADTLKSEVHAYQSSQKTWTDYGKEEPLSGIQGKGTPTDPYDAGNRDEQPGAPDGQQNTALVPEALVSTADDDTKKSRAQAPVPNGSAGAPARPDSSPTGNKFVGVMNTPEQRTQPPPPSLTTPTTGRASVMDGLYGRDSVAAAAGGSGTNGEKAIDEKNEESAGSRPVQAQQKSQNPITSTGRFDQTPNGIEKSEDAQNQPAKAASLNDQSTTVPPTTFGSQTSNMDEDTRRLSLQKDKYTGAEMSKRQSLMGSQSQGGAAAAGENGAANEGNDYIDHNASQSHAAGLSISGTPGVPGTPERPAAPMSKVSEEALKGPQCSAKPPYDFEKQLDDPSGRRKSKSSHKKSNSFGDANAKSAEKTPSSEESAKSGSKNSSKNGRQSTLSHMKEKLEKVVHRGNHSNK